MASVLIISALQIFPERSGGHMRTGSLARALASAGHKVRIFSFTGRKDDLLRCRKSFRHHPTPGVEEFVSMNLLRGLIAIAGYRLGLPPIWIWAERAMRVPKKLQEDLEWADIIVWDFPYCSAKADLLREKPVVLNSHNVEASLWPERGIGKLTKSLVTTLERSALQQASLICGCSEADLTEHKRVNTNAKTLLIPNGIDLSRFRSTTLTREEARRMLGLPADAKIFLYAASAYGPNLEGLDLLRSYLRDHGQEARRLKAHILVVGSVGRIRESSELLTVTGKVEAVEPYFLAADFALNPILSGSGTSLKLAEYMAAGLPALTTTTGARGYQLADGISALYFSGAHDLGAAIERAVAVTDTTVLAETALQENLAKVDARRTCDPLLSWITSVTSEDGG